MSFDPPNPNEKDPFRIVATLRQLGEGRRNTAGSVTLTASATTTAVTHVNFGALSTPNLFPASSTAAAELGNGTIWVSTRANQSFTLTHANSSVATRTFYYSFDG